SGSVIATSPTGATTSRSVGLVFVQTVRVSSPTSVVVASAFSSGGPSSVWTGDGGRTCAEGRAGRSHDIPWGASGKVISTGVAATAVSEVMGHERSRAARAFLVRTRRHPPEEGRTGQGRAERAVRAVRALSPGDRGRGAHAH